MKILKIEISNVGPIAHEVIELNKPLLIFYGEIQQGKSTILNAVRWCFGGSFPTDIIRHGEKEAFVELTFDGGSIRREWYVSKDGTTKARDVEFIRAGKAVKSPVAEIKRFLNPFLLDQDFFRRKNEQERKLYFTELFAVDTRELDTELHNVERDASSLRSKISGYGEIDLKVVERVDVAEVKAKRQQLVDAHNAKIEGWKSELSAIQLAHDEEVLKVDTENQARSEHTLGVRRKQTELQTTDEKIAEMERQLKSLREERASIDNWLKSNPSRELLSRPKAPDVTALENNIRSTPDTADLDARISEAAATNVRAEQYEANKTRAEAKRADQDKLSALEARGRQIKKDKQTRLASISQSCGIAGLTFDDAGDFSFEGVSAGMMSDSQIMRLSELLSAKYPEGFGLGLIDRGESLGKSVFTLIERAKDEEKTILVTVVGDKPSTVPDEVGVFVVEKGAIKP